MSSASSLDLALSRIYQNDLHQLGHLLRLLQARRIPGASAVRACRRATSGDRFEADFFPVHAPK